MPSDRGGTDGQREAFRVGWIRMVPSPAWNSGRHSGLGGDAPEDTGELAPGPELDGREIAFRPEAAVDEFLERVSRGVNIAPDVEEGIRAAAAGKLSPPEALAAAYDTIVEMIRQRNPDAANWLTEPVQSELRAAFLAKDEIEAAWIQQGDLNPRA